MTCIKVCQTFVLNFFTLIMHCIEDELVSLVVLLFHSQHSARDRVKMSCWEKTSLLNSITAAVKSCVYYSMFFKQTASQIVKSPLFYLHEDWISFPDLKRWALNILYYDLSASLHKYDWRRMKRNIIRSTRNPLRY